MSTAAPAPPPPAASLIHLTTAPAYYGAILAWLMLGFIIVQTYEYRIRHHNDPWIMHLCVYGTVFLTIAQTGIETYCGTYYFVQFWGQSSAISAPPKPLVFQTLFDGVVGFIVQVFFLWRIWAFVGRSLIGRLLCAFTAILSLLALSCSLAIPIIFVQVDNLALLKMKTGNLNLIWLAATAATDAFIAAYMIVILTGLRSRSTQRDTISKLIRVTIQTGLLTFCVALLVLLIRVNVKVGTLHTIGAYLLGKSYVLSLLLNLNTRIKMRESDSNPSKILHSNGHEGLASTMPPNTATEQHNDPSSNSTYELRDVVPNGNPANSAGHNV